MKLIKTNDPNIPAENIAKDINNALEGGKKVLWFVAGGSSMSVAVLASKLITPTPILTVILTDERYGMPGDKNSNEEQLKNLGFKFPIVSVLEGKPEEDTILDFANVVEKSLNNNDIVFGLFGVGPDGHVAGIMPESPATKPDVGFALGYQAPNFYRLTITPNVISKMDKVYLWMQGEAKKEALERLMTEFPKELQPGQYLKDAKEFEIYTDIEI